MAANIDDNKPDQLDSLIRRYLTVNDVLHAEAYEVVTRWYTYLNAMSNAAGNEISGAAPKMGMPAVELAFETPITGFMGNSFWQQHHQTILPLVAQDIARHRLLTRYDNKPDLVVAINVIAKYGFIGQVVALVQQDGMTSWTNFELEFRELMELVVRKHLESISGR